MERRHRIGSDGLLAEACLADRAIVIFVGPLGRKIKLTDGFDVCSLRSKIHWFGWKRTFRLEHESHAFARRPLLDLSGALLAMAVSWSYTRAFLR